MAYVVSTQIPGVSLADHFHALVQRIKSARARAARYAQAYRELNSMTDRELAEFGMHRGDLEAIARREAYGE